MSELIDSGVEITKMTTEEAITRFGFDPASIGRRHRGWWVTDEEYRPDISIDDWSFPAGVLIVEARDGASNPVDPEAFRKPNYLESYVDWSDSTYRYYVFTPLMPDEVSTD